MNQATVVTPELVSSALLHISASGSRDEWAGVGMAIKSEFPDSTGLALFDKWSASAGDQYDPKAVASTWRSIKGSGGVTVATLFHRAKENGWHLPKTGRAPAAPTAAEMAERERQRAERQQAEQQRTEAGHAAAATLAADQWAQGREDGESPYLNRKGVKPYGVRFAPGGWLLVPLRDGAGKLCNLQRIAPQKPVDGGPEKLFLKNGKKSGLWHLLGDMAGGDVPDIVLIAEGFSTSATLREATGHPVACAFDAGNLQPVARALRQRYPGALLVVCGDDDHDTEATSGSNPGRIKATAAARAVGGLAVFPADLPVGASDFNDLHQHHGGIAGLEVVRNLVQSGIDAHAAAQVREPAHGKAPRNAKAKGQAGRPQHNGASGPPDRPGGAGDNMSDASNGEGPPDWDRFSSTDAGVFYRGVDRDGKPTAPEWVCSRLEVEALTRDRDGQGWGFLLAFADPVGKTKQWAMPARMLAGDGGEYRAALLGMGLRVSTNSRARNLLTQYIQSREPGELATCTDTIGWHGSAFVLPNETIGDGAGRVVFQSEGAQPNTFRAKGTEAQWKSRIGAACRGNSRLIFGVSCALVGPLLRPAGAESGGVHFRGDSSCGKSTIQTVVASVYGGPSFKQSWKSTDNAVEGLAAQHNDCVLVLDEIGEVEGGKVGDIAYMLGNGQGKARASRTGLPRARLAWLLNFVSSGEKSLADHQTEAGKRTRAGQEVRMVDIPADAGKGMGVFENLHGHEGGANFSRYLVGQAKSVYGAVGRAWLQWLTENESTLESRIREASAALEMQIIPEAAGGQVERVGARFALIGAAGEIATAAGLTGWAPGESEDAARDCFNAWLVSRGGIGNGEVTAMLRQVRRFLEAHGEGRFTWWHRASDDHNTKTLHRAGFRRMLNDRGEPIKTNHDHASDYGSKMTPAFGEGVSVEYFVMSEVFKSEVCQGFDPNAVARVLLEHECLVTKEPGRFNVRERLPSIGLSRCYRISARIFELDL